MKTIYNEKPFKKKKLANKLQKNEKLELMPQLMKLYPKHMLNPLPRRRLIHQTKTRNLQNLKNYPMSQIKLKEVGSLEIYFLILKLNPRSHSHCGHFMKKDRFSLIFITEEWTLKILICSNVLMIH